MLKRYTLCPIDSLCEQAPKTIYRLNSHSTEFKSFKRHKHKKTISFSICFYFYACPLLDAFL